MESKYCDSNGEVSPKQKSKSISAEPTISNSKNDCFDCNICLESAHDPVVTFCGHLYCWPCIYKWLDVQSSSVEPDQQQTCPVCKAEISHTSLVPLYGKSNSESEEKKLQKMSVGIPHRPPPYNLNAIFFNPIIVMFGEMVLTRIFGVSDANMFAYPHNRSGSPRMRRQEMQIDKSLNRLSIFLLCCIILCLLLF
uniref:E3 ubiquitin-protein ligase RMA n=1 Tax=Cajanus cajan TaxID=3821 RepID=A0A151S256_CAJCA|nr:RING finger protein 5 [Cajanus cajan]